MKKGRMQYAPTPIPQYASPQAPTSFVRGDPVSTVATACQEPCAEALL